MVYRTTRIPPGETATNDFERPTVRHKGPAAAGPRTLDSPPVARSASRPAPRGRGVSRGTGRCSRRVFFRILRPVRRMVDTLRTGRPKLDLDQIGGLFGRSVDLLTPGSIRPAYRDQILSSAEDVCVAA